LRIQKVAKKRSKRGKKYGGSKPKLMTSILGFTAAYMIVNYFVHDEFFLVSPILEIPMCILWGIIAYMIAMRRVMRA